MKGICILTTLGVALASGFSAWGYGIATRGQAADSTVVVPAKASESQLYAARELTNYIARTTGVALPIQRDTKPKPARAILLGETAYTAAALGSLSEADRTRIGTDGFRIKVCGDDLVIYGSDKRGTLYGVYEVLEKFAGCKWYSSWTEIVPRLTRVALPDGYDDTQTPAFVYREPYWYDMIHNPDFAARSRANGPGEGLKPKHGGPVARFGAGLGNCHTFVHLLPRKHYAKEHPEYYAIHNGKRTCDVPGDEQWRVQPCLSNPDVLRVVTSNLLARIRRDPSAEYYGVSQNDNDQYCQCPRCTAINEEESSTAGTMVRFINAVAEAVEKEYPGKIIETLAYRHTRKPPTKSKYRHNVMPCLCSIECDFSRPLDKSPYPQNISFVKDIKGWAAQVKQLYVWDYVTDFHYYPQPMANVYALRENLRFFRDNDVSCMFEQGDRQGAHGGFAELKAWLIAKFMWNPDRPLKPLLDEFFAGYYGAGAPYARQFFEEVHAAQLAYSSADPMHALECEPRLLTPGVPIEVFDRGDALIEQAMAAVKGDALRELNVRTLRFSIDYVRVLKMNAKYPLIMFSAQSTTYEMACLRRKLAQRALAFFKERPGIRLCSDERREERYLNEWKYLSSGGEPTVAMDGVVQDYALELAGLGKWTQRITDKKASDGRAVVNYNVRPGWSTTMPMGRIGFVSNVTYRVSVRVRLSSPCEPGRDGPGFSAGIYSTERTKSLCGKYVKASEMGVDYAWYELGGICDPLPTDYFFFAAGHRAKDGKPHCGHAVLDCIKFEEVK